MSERLDSFVNKICAGYIEKNKIDAEHYEKLRVFRGLRNPDGTGVLAGLTRVGSVQGAVLVDGERVPVEGKLFYRGIEIRDLIQGFMNEGRYGFAETIYLTLMGDLPTSAQLEEFSELLDDLRQLPDGFTEDMIIRAPSKDIMNKIARSILALYSYDPNPDDCSPQNLIRQSLELIARIPTIVGHAYAVKRHYFDNYSLVLHRPKLGHALAEDLLYMLRPDGHFTNDEARMLDLCLVLHAEHGGGNNSAFATRVVSSSGTDTYSALAAAIGSLKGPRHGGANNKVVAMLKDIMENVSNWQNRDELSAYIAKLIRKEAGDRSGLIYGMGHAVYTLSDPRAIVLKEFARKLASARAMLAEYELIEAVEELTPKIFAEVKNDTKVISANVDLYSGFVYSMLNIPTELYTPMFAISRMVGWCSHRIEEAVFGGRIIRPAYRPVTKERNYVPLSERDL
ncbi:MAG: citrate/2-methylcitrate synthase [Oscillospiraceae bacterium]|nr:citrate/2-methylcitrate synthase [Oscillospiraceae bacterium]